jgi:hypothetical protein
MVSVSARSADFVSELMDLLLYLTKLVFRHALSRFSTNTGDGFDQRI